jgi:nicotinate dehydrogenase subunit B
VNANGIGVDGKFVTPSGAGEPSTRPTVAAIANAVFDATGVRVRRAPLTPAVVLSALKAAGRAA